jgi:aryl sulfotransferase
VAIPIRYRSPDEDSRRWLDFDFRPGDIVISTRSKCGTTWVQMICALLVFQSPDLPTPLSELSPWLDFLADPADEIYARLAAQTHRRFIMTHTPLDGVVIDGRATYVVVARHPLDAAISMSTTAATSTGNRSGGSPVSAVSPRTSASRSTSVAGRSWCTRPRSTRCGGARASSRRRRVGS